MRAEVRGADGLAVAQEPTGEDVIVSYNGDLRGVVEDVLHKTRRVRCSVSSFNNVGALVDGTALLATVPALVAEPICLARPHLRTARLPFALAGTPMDLLWSVADGDDDAGRFSREKIVSIARAAPRRPVRGLRHARAEDGAAHRADGR